LNNRHEGGESGQRVLSTSLAMPFAINHAMQVGAMRTGGPLHEVASNYLPITVKKSRTNVGSHANLQTQPIVSDFNPT